MHTHDTDCIVIGAGIAGASAACFMAADRRVVLLEMEDAPGYHTTGRSAALWILNYGPPSVRALTALARDFLLHPPADFADTSLVAPRLIAYAAPADQVAALHAMIAKGQGIREIPVAELRAIVPALRADYAVAAAVEDEAYTIDVAALHQAYLRQARRHGANLAVNSRATHIDRRDGRWEVVVKGGTVFRAPVLVNAAGAWGDEVAAMAGAAPIGLVPKRRTGLILDPGRDVADWPFMHDLAGEWYFGPQGHNRLMASPADETPTHPHDVQPEEIDIAITVDRLQQVLDITFARVERSWAGLRTFTPDGNLAIGWDGAADGFLWCVGQGGYGIQTSATAGRLVADLVAARDPGAASRLLPGLDPRRFA